MAKKLSKLNTNTKPKSFICAKCGEKFGGDQFYAFASKPAGVIPICKPCCYAYSINADGLSRQGIIDMCKFINLPFFQNYFDEILTKNVSDKWKVSQYFNKLRAHSRIEELTFKDSIFEVLEDFDKIEEEVVDLNENFTPMTEVSDEERITKERRSVKQQLEEMRAKWGKYDSLEYMQRCEALYQEIVQGGYIIRSAMHDISIRNYCKIQIDWDIAQENKDYEAMRELKQPLKDARKDAKLNPDQLRPEDFTTGGANSFSEIGRMVAKRDGFIPFPMKYYKKPTDALDFLMWELVNYDRHVLGLPEVEYEEIYHHYIDRVNEFNKQYKADIENGDLGTLDPSTKGKKKEYKII